MLDLYYWTTPNGHKITIFLEEAELEYNIKPVDISKGEQFEDEFLEISPNNKIPALVDSDSGTEQGQITIFESGAILQYLGEKTGRFFPQQTHKKYQVLQWLFWQMAHLGPMLGQNHHFSKYAPEKLDYAIDRYQKETERLYGILDDQLEHQTYIAQDYSIADMACYPWVLPEQQGIDLQEYPNIARWKSTIGDRAAVKRAYDRAEQFKNGDVVTEESRKILFGQARRIKHH